MRLTVHRLNFHNHNHNHSTNGHLWGQVRSKALGEARDDARHRSKLGIFLIIFCRFLSDPGIPGPFYGSYCLSLSERGCADFTDVTLADEDTDSILTDHANMEHSKAMWQ